MDCPRDYDCFECTDRNTGFCRIDSEHMDEMNEIGPIDLKLKDTKTGKEYSKRLTLEEYAAILYLLKVVEWR